MYFWNGIKQRWQKVGCVAFSQNDNKRLILGSLKRRRQRKLQNNSNRFRPRQVINQKRVRVFDRGIQTPRNRWNLEENERIISLCTLYTCGWLLHLNDLRIGEGATDQILLLCAFNRSDVAVKKNSSVPCGDIFVASFANRQNYWHSRAAKHLKRHCLHRNLCWDFCQTSSLRNLIHRTAEVK